VSFASLAQPAIEPLIERFAAAPQVTVVVGAGASMEAGLPSWPELIERLLRRVARGIPRLADDADRADWIARTLGRDELLGAAAVVELMADAELDELLPRALYGAAGPGGYEPGPIAQQVAELWSLFGDDITILTTNYDDLIERALLGAGATRRQIRPYVRRQAAPPADAAPVTHLHGYAGREGRPRRLVLTEEHYHRMQRGRSWQEQYVIDRLEHSLCLFIGTSLTDPNLIRYLYGYRAGGRRHAAIFVRQGDLEHATPAVRAAREEAIGKRWRRCGVEPAFVDHYADAAQLLYEIRHRRSVGAEYEPLPARARRTLSLIERVLLAADGGGDAFGRRQVELSRWLRSHLYDLLGTALDGGSPPGDERLALALWLLSPDGMRITGWVHSDRAHQDPATIEAVPIASGSEWVAARTVCQGVRVELDRESAVSRWHFVRGLPLVLEAPTRMPIGCLTISSTRRGADSVLNGLDAPTRAELHRALTTTIVSAIQQLPGI
jgi:SIR2-like domain